MKNRISFYTLGCRLNQSETAVIENTFAADGYRIVKFSEPADYVVINTCTVTENGDTDTRRLVNRISRLNPGARIALIGCQAQVQKNKLTELPNVRWVIGNAKKFDLLSIIKELNDAETPQVIVPAIPRKSFTLPISAIDRQHTRANLKIQDGCDFFCSFCEIPYARGRARSRKFTDILTDAKALAKAGHKEVVLTGINLGTYQDEKKTFLDVINALEQIDGLKRIRISSIEPTTIPLALLDKMARQTKLCRYLHVPLQSASNKILRLMKRKYTAEQFRDFLLKAHHRVPQICLGTDIIVGFPGETGIDFEETMVFLKELPFAYFHVFSYSQRTMAKSRKLPHKVPTPVIQRRSTILRELSTRKRRMFYESLIGTTQKVLLEQKKNNFWSGLTDNYVRITLEVDGLSKNKILPVKIISIFEQSALGTLNN